MKKLNITKEQFNSSRYFKNKYGKLEYVSESGKLFKTNKGKVLMFKESIKDIAPGIQDWGTTVYVEPLDVEMSWDDVYYIVKKDCRQYPLLEEELGLEPYEEPDDEQIREWIETKPKSFIDYLKEFGSYNATDFSGDDEYDESTRKFSKKLTKESGDIEDEVWSKWERMSDEIEENINFEEVARNAAKKYFPRYADEIANWLKNEIELIFTNGYVEDWTEMENSLHDFADYMGIQISDMA